MRNIHCFPSNYPIGGTPSKLPLEARHGSPFAHQAQIAYPDKLPMNRKQTDHFRHITLDTTPMPHSFRTMPLAHTIIAGDSRDMRELSSKSVHLIVTSPPYWQLKDYGANAQIGFNDTYETYVNWLNLVWEECFRVLHDGCRLCVNVGDQFARSTYYGRYKVIPIHAEIIRACENVGFDFMGQIIWQKNTTTNTTGGASVMGSFPTPRNGIVKLDFEYILLFKKNGTAPAPTSEQKENSKMTRQEWNTFFNGHWCFPGSRQEKHLAMFPEELPRRLIRMFSFPGETVLDPFMGSGTTAAAAHRLGRNSIGYEINPGFIPIIEEKIAAAGDIFSPPSVIVKNQGPPDGAVLAERVKRQQFPFIDVHKLDKKMDVKKLQYGSRIDAQNSPKREEFFTIKEVISTELIRLGNGLVVRLLGIKENPAVSDRAIAFLREKLKGGRVFLRHDTPMHDEQNNLLAYLYLANKTFINAHLIKKQSGVRRQLHPTPFARKIQPPVFRGATIRGTIRPNGITMIQPAKYSLDFGKKEKVLNCSCQTYQLSRPGKVGAVMALIRECRTATIEEWEN